MIAALVVFVVAGGCAVIGADRGRRAWLVAGKPVATAALLAVVGFPTGTFATRVVAGLVLSLVGDVLLLGRGDVAFGAGMAVFVGAHLCYVAAFRSVAAPGVALLLGVGIPWALLSGWLVLAIRRGLARSAAPAWLLPGVVVYTVALTGTAVCAFGTFGGPLRWPLPAVLAAGACLFYAADAGLAWNQFRAPIRHASYLTLGVYWLGQLCFALAARFSR